jgi:Tfp pilus tip-associated adhesin PilY1
MQKRLLLLAGLALWISSAAATADDKDLLKRGTAPPNVMIVFGNSQTTEQPILGSSSAWDGDADSPASKMGAAKAVVRQFVNDKYLTFNFGMTSFSHNPNAGSITLHGKHWLYSPLTVDFPLESWKEPIGTIERWGVKGEGPCTNLTVPVCTDRSPSFVTLPAGVAGAIGPFFGVPTVPAFIYLDGTIDNKGLPKNATKRIQVTLTAGAYGDAFTDGTLSTLALGDHSMQVKKVYQKDVSGVWQDQANTDNGSPGTVFVNYVPSATLTSDLFYTTGTDAGKEVGFLNDPQTDVDVNANCAGWEFQSNSNPQPLIKIPRDYKWGATCAPPQNSLPCVTRLLRPQAKLVRYDQTSGAFTTADPDNPGYTDSTLSKYADGCDSTLMGAVDIGLDVTENQAIMITRNGSQAPIKNLLTDAYKYFTEPAIDGFQNGKRTDDPNKACRTSAVILIYDNFNGCQNDDCTVLTNFILTRLKTIGVPVYVIGFGASASATSSTGVCIAQNTGAILPDSITPGYFPVSDAAGLYQVLNDIASILNQSPQTFSAAAVSTSQAQGDQMAYFASFSPTRFRSIWNGRLIGYRLDPNPTLADGSPNPNFGKVQLGQFTITDPNDANKGATIPFPSNNPSSLIWNAGQNLVPTSGAGATDPAKILAPAAALSTGSYFDSSNDGAPTTIPTRFYPGRKIVFSLPQSIPSPLTTLPVPAADGVPENRYDMTFTTGASWWPTLKALLGPQTTPPFVLSPALDDTDAGNSLRFIWGDRDAVTGATVLGYQYSGLKLGDVLHSGPLLVGNPNDFALFKTNTSGYQAFFNTYKNRRRVLYVAANDGLLHAFDAGVVGRDTSQPTIYDLGTGAELFAFAPRAIMQIYKPLKDAVGPQTKRDEWTVDLSTSAADAFIDAGHSGTPVPANRAWHTVLVGGEREGSPFEGTDGASPAHSQGSYFALDITQPDELVGDPPVESPGTFNAPKCLNASGDATCARDWPTVLWEITDTSDADSNGAPDMGETWSKPAMGRVRVCTADCGNTSAPLPTFEDHYVAVFGGGFDRERLNSACAPTCNRRGNWLYMVDLETGFALYKVNSGVANFGSGNVTVNFGSIPSGPTALDSDADGYLDLIYVGDLKGQLWRIDLTDLRKLSPSLVGRFDNKLDLVSGSGKPFLFFQAPQPTSPAATPFYPIYHRPEAINLGYNAGGKPALGIAFGTGDRDDILATVDPSSLASKQRFYYIADAPGTTTTTESTSGLQDISSPTDVTHPALAKGWFLELTNGERVVADSLTTGGIIRFPTFNPISIVSAGDACANTSKCSGASGISRQYQVFYNTGNAYPLGSVDRGQTQVNATFITGTTGYVADNGEAFGLFWSHGPENPNLGLGRKITVRSWKEKTSSP